MAANHEITATGGYVWDKTVQPDREQFDTALAHGKNHGNQASCEIAQRILKSPAFTAAEKDLFIRQAVWAQHHDAEATKIRALPYALMASVRNDDEPSEAQKAAAFARLEALPRGYDGERSADLEGRINALAEKIIAFCAGKMDDLRQAPLLIGSMAQRYNDGNHFLPAAEQLEELATADRGVHLNLELAKTSRPDAYYGEIPKSSNTARNVAAGIGVAGGLALTAAGVKKAYEAGLLDRALGWLSSFRTASEHDSDEDI